MSLEFSKCDTNNVKPREVFDVINIMQIIIIINSANNVHYYHNVVLCPFTHPFQCAVHVHIIYLPHFPPNTK